eukprot:Colp12_sorted_trinity150504_noHs@21825
MAKTSTTFFVVLVGLATVLQAQEALPKIPGHDLFGVGFDALTLQTTRLPVFTLTYTDDAESVFNYYDDSWRFPLEVYCVNTPSSEATFKTSVYNDSETYYNEVRERHTKHGFLGIGSKSTETIKITKKFFQFNQAFSQSEQIHSFFTCQLAVFPPPTLHPLVQTALSQLPATYSSDVNSESFRKYREFITDFGTHFMTEITMGGRVQMTSYFDACLISTFDGQWVTKQSGSSLLGIVKWGSGSSSEDTHTDAHWDMNSEHEVLLRGGAADLYDPSDWKSWVHSIMQNPSPLEYSLTAITEILPQGTTRSNLEQAVAAYLGEGATAYETLKAELKSQSHWVRPDWCKRF